MSDVELKEFETFDGVILHYNNVRLQSGGYPSVGDPLASLVRWRASDQVDFLTAFPMALTAGLDRPVS